MSRLALALLCALSVARGAVYVEAEDFVYRGSWEFQAGAKGCFGSGLLCNLTEGGGYPAVAAVDIPEAGAYRLLVRAKDFPEDRPGIRRLTVEVDGKRSETEFGAHGRADADGWDWEDGGTFELPQGRILIALLGLTSYCRCDALGLVREGEDVPHSTAQAKAARQPLPRIEPVEGGLTGTIPPTTDPGLVLTQLANDYVRLTFRESQVEGQPAVALVAEAKRGGQWVEVMPATAETYQVVWAEPEVELRPDIWPYWNKSFQRLVTLEAHGVSYQTSQNDNRAIVSVGEHVMLHPTAVESLGPDRVRLTAKGDVGEVIATWSLAQDERLPALTLEFTAAAAGSYGLGYGAGPTLPREQVGQVLCPFLYAWQRLPEDPKLVGTQFTPTPLAVVQPKGDTTRTVGVAFDPSQLSQEWPDVRVTKAGFQLADPTGAIRPTAWSPIPGGVDSALSAGDTATLKVRLVGLADDWFETYREVACGLYGLKDYRHNHGLSLTDTALNVIDLMKDADASGWSDDGLGFWNIEGANAVTYAAPLAVLEAALLTGDEDLLETRAIPGLAAVLSRPSTHFSVNPSHIGRLGRPSLGGPMTLYGSIVRYGADAMTHGYTPAFRQWALDAEGNPVKTGGYSKVRWFEDALTAWRHTGDERYLELAKQDLAAYVPSYFQQQTTELSPIPFYQISYVGNWEGLLHAAQELQDPELLADAEAIAKRMITGLWTQPQVVDGPMTVHPGGEFVGNSIRWWKGAQTYLLGFPGDGSEEQRGLVGPAKVPEEQVPGWIPSMVGLGFEQPVTYRRSKTPCAAITMANWAPGLLRLAGATGEPLFSTAAHNGLIGRWGNYPGYYVTGFNNVMTQPDFPYRGPDVSSIYYHHIPPFLGMLLDYLVTDVEVRSNGKIKFPSERQCGYAWFDNRTFGHAPGKVDDQDGAWLWLRRGLVTTDTPLVNWLAAHDSDTVWVMLTNTSADEVEVQVKLDPTATGGARGPVRVAVGNGAYQPAALRGGAVTVTVPPQGLTVLEWQGCLVSVPFHQVQPVRAAQPERAVAAAEGDAVVGKVHAEWLGVDPDHQYVHVYSEHDGSLATQAELKLSDAGQTRVLKDAAWPLEFISKVSGKSRVTLELTAIEGDGSQHVAPVVTLEPPAG